MTDAEALEIVRRHFEGLFPKTCGNCSKRFATLLEYMRFTTPLGLPRSLDADLADWNTKEPIGSLVHADCPCGSTLTLSTDGMPIERRLALLEWLRTGAQRRGASPSEMLGWLREEIRKRVLAEPLA